MSSLISRGGLWQGITVLPHQSVAAGEGQYSVKLHGLSAKEFPENETA